MNIMRPNNYLGNMIVSILKIFSKNAVIFDTVSQNLVN